MKNILLILGHPDTHSFTAELMSEYERACREAGFSVDLIILNDLRFDLNLESGFTQNPPVESDLVTSQNRINRANHIVFFYPLWWGNMPALLKGFIDRIFLPGFAFKYHSGGKLEKLLKGKSSRIIITMDNGTLHYRFKLLGAAHRGLKYSVLEFCGIKPVKISLFGGVRRAGPEIRDRWIRQIHRLGSRGM